jgi:hypothetical protein
MKLRGHAAAHLTAGAIMEERTSDTLEDEIFRAAKREQQEQSRAQVRSGARTQESMLFIAPSIVRASKFRRRTDEF